MPAAITPECFDEMHSVCDSDACGCSCHLRCDEVLDPEPYNDTEGEPDYTLDDDEEFEESLGEALRWPLP